MKFFRPLFFVPPIFRPRVPRPQPASTDTHRPDRRPKRIHVLWTGAGQVPIPVVIEDPLPDYFDRR